MWQFNTGLTALPDNYLETAAPDNGISDSHPGLAQAMAAVSRATADLERARRQRFGNPMLSLGTRLERGAAPDHWNTAIALGVNVPLGLASQSAPAIAAANYALTEASVERARVRRSLQEMLMIAQRQLALVRRSLATAQQVEKLARQSLHMTRRAFSLGEVDLFTLLQMRSQVLNKTWDATRLKLEKGRDIARLNQALGVVPQ
jgi:outer membrane protein TolC